MNLKLTAAWFYGALVVLTSVWVLHGFLEPLLAAGVIAIASWPLYRRFAGWLPQSVTRGAASIMFTSMVTAFVLGPLTFALFAFVSESRTLVHDIALADEKGVPVFAFAEDVAASGGYWLALAADEIYSEEASLLGSIGVVTASVLHDSRGPVGFSGQTLTVRPG